MANCPSQQKHNAETAIKADLGVAAIRITDTPQVLIDAAKQMLEKVSSMGYSDVQGLPQIRQKGAQNYAKTEGLDHVDAARVALINGARSGSNSVIEYISIIAPGSTILGPSLRWPEYEEQATRIGLKYQPVLGAESSYFAPIASDFLPWIKNGDTKLLIITNPGNPLGNNYSREQLKDI